MKKIGTVNKTKDTLKKYGFHVKKKFGQNFLVDQNILQKHPKLASNLSKKIQDWLEKKHPTWKPKFPLSKKDGTPVLPKFL